MSSSTGEPQHYPMQMARFGLNPHGKNLYRVVFAPSVRHLIGGTWRDGAKEYRSRPAYPQVGNEWVLERWISAQEFCGMTKDEYDIRFRDLQSGLLRTGPYPVEGTYVMCLDAPIKPEAIVSVGTLISGIEHGRKNRSHAREVQNGQLIAADMVASEKAADDIALDRIRELRPAFGNRPTSFAGGVHSTKSRVDITRPAPFKPGGMKVLRENKANA